MSFCCHHHAAAVPALRLLSVALFAWPTRALDRSSVESSDNRVTLIPTTIWSRNTFSFRVLYLHVSTRVELYHSADSPFLIMPIKLCLLE